MQDLSGRATELPPPPRVEIPPPSELRLEQAMLPREAFFARIDHVPWQQAAGRVVAELLTPYPPGIPAALPGERLTEEVLRAEPFLAFFEPPSLDERVVNQSSVLSAFSEPTFQLEQWLERHPRLWRGWVIPAEVKAEIRQRLDQANITERVLLPGLDGLADWLRPYYSPGSIRYGEADGGATMAG